MYVSAYNSASSELAECCKRCSDVDNFLSVGHIPPPQTITHHNPTQRLAQSNETAHQTIYAYLIQPVQRIPRYRLLLADLLKHTSKRHNDWSDLQQAHSLVCETAALVNTKTADAERTLKVNRHRRP